MKTTIFCCSDTHGKAPPLPKKVDYFLHAGDFYDYLGQLRHGMSERDFAGLKNNKQILTEWKKNLSCPSFFVRGNHDVYDLHKIMSEDISGKLHRLSDGLVLVGIGWSGGVFCDLPLERDIIPICESLFDQAAAEMKQGEHSIILTHYPPYIEQFYSSYGEGYDEGFVFKAVKKAMEAFRPVLLIQGHLHQKNGITFTYDGTMIVHPGPVGMTIEIDEANVRIIAPQSELPGTHPQA